MASTNKTTHYDLSQYVGSDKPTYLGDYNTDMSKIDTGINTAQTTADSASTAATNAQTTAETAQTTANTAVTNAATAQNTADSANTNIGIMANLTTTDKSTLVNAINEVNSKPDKVGDLSNLSTSDKTNVVNAINEVESDIQHIGEIVWINENPSSHLSGRVVNINLSEYVRFKIYYYLDSDLGSVYNQTGNKNSNIILQPNANYDRTIAITDNAITIGDGHYQGAVNNNSVVPSHIYAYKQ